MKEEEIKVPEEEIKAPVEVGRTEFFAKLGSLEVYYRNQLEKAFQGLQQAQKLRCEIEQAEYDKLIVKFYMSDGNLTYTTKGKDPLGFKTGVEKVD